MGWHQDYVAKQQAKGRRMQKKYKNAIFSRQASFRRTNCKKKYYSSADF